MTVVITRETPDQVEVRTFLAAADELYVSLYPTESRKALSLAKLLSTNVRFFVARRDGRALGCGGYMLLDEKAAEMKRLFVDPAARGQGVGRLIVRAIEHAAVQEGVETLFLETGVKSFEAIGLYKGQDFLECGPFAAYEPDPLSIFMSKRLGMGSSTRRGHRSNRAYHPAFWGLRSTTPRPRSEMRRIREVLRLHVELGRI